jgi:hypothetical protein
MLLGWEVGSAREIPRLAVFWLRGINHDLFLPLAGVVVGSLSVAIDVCVVGLIDTEERPWFGWARFSGGMFCYLY